VRSPPARHRLCLRTLGTRSAVSKPQLPPAAGNLTRLHFLNASGNDLSGALPAQLLALPELRVLDMTANGRLAGARLPVGGRCTQAVLSQLLWQSSAAAVPELLWHSTALLPAQALCPSSLPRSAPCST
jgi:hypothetical protein